MPGRLDLTILTGDPAGAETGTKIRTRRPGLDLRRGPSYPPDSPKLLDSLFQRLSSLARNVAESRSQSTLWTHGSTTGTVTVNVYDLPSTDAGYLLR